jgi:tyrosine-protein kinase Etk/Wzc
LGALVTGLVFFFLLLVRTIFQGFPRSLEILKAMRLPVLGEISSGESLETLRQIGLFCERDSNAKVISILASQGPDYSIRLAANLARKSLRSLVVRCDFSSDSSSGLLQSYKGKSLESCLQAQDGFDLLASGGATPYGLELVQSSFFQDMLQKMKQKYDFILLFFSAPLSSAVSEVALKISDKVVATIAGEKAQELTSLMSWAYHEGNGRLTFVVADSI